MKKLFIIFFIAICTFVYTDETKKALIFEESKINELVDVFLKDKDFSPIDSIEIVYDDIDISVFRLTQFKDDENWKNSNYILFKSDNVLKLIPIDIGNMKSFRRLKSALFNNFLFEVTNERINGNGEIYLFDENLTVLFEYNYFDNHYEEIDLNLCSEIIQKIVPVFGQVSNVFRNKHLEIAYTDNDRCIILSGIVDYVLTRYINKIEIREVVFSKNISISFIYDDTVKLYKEAREISTYSYNMYKEQ